MKKIKDITENEMIAVFLKAEVDSPRFGPHIWSRLQRDSKSRKVIDAPDLNSVSENSYRKQLLGEYRGYGLNQYLFTGFPKNVKWEKVSLDKDELRKIKYINYPYWLPLSNGTRLPTEAVKNINNGAEIDNQSNASFIEGIKEVKKGKIFPEMILISRAPGEMIVVIEGNSRLTVYNLAINYMPQSIEAIIGYSDEFNSYGLY